MVKQSKAEEAALNLRARQSWSSGPVTVKKDDDGFAMYLFGSRIGLYTYEGKLLTSLCGHPTDTTRRYLNAIYQAFQLPMSINQIRHEQVVAFYDDPEVVVSSIDTMVVDLNNAKDGLEVIHGKA